MFRRVRNLVLTKAGEETRAGIQQRLYAELGQLVRDRLAPTG